ncbi:enoyl-CoA hydratase/isomerase family protein [Oceanobacillus sp. CAU 1775]
MSSTILTEWDDEIAFIYFNRPEKMNALSEEVVSHLHKALKEVAEKNPKVVVLSGKGRAFSAGHDLEGPPLDPSSMEAQKFMQQLQEITQLIVNMPVPVIASVNGYALGAGCEIAMNCDLILASEKAVFGFPEVKVGLSITQGTSYYLPRMVGLAKAKELLFFSENFSAEKALELGMINIVVPENKLQEQTEKWAKELVTKPAHALAAAKKLLNQGMDSTLQPALVKEIEVVQELLSNNR